MLQPNSCGFVPLKTMAGEPPTPPRELSMMMPVRLVLDRGSRISGNCPAESAALTLLIVMLFTLASPVVSGFPVLFVMLIKGPKFSSHPRILSNDQLPGPEADEFTRWS